MPINLRWDDPERSAIRIDTEGQWSWTEFRKAVEETVIMITAHGQRVGLIVYRKHQGYTPPGNMLAHFQHAIQHISDHVTLIAIISPNPFARKVVNILLKVHRSYAHKVVFVASLEEARALFAEREPSRMG